MEVFINVRSSHNTSNIAFQQFGVSLQDECGKISQNGITFILSFYGFFLERGKIIRYVKLNFLFSQSKYGIIYKLFEWAAFIKKRNDEDLSSCSILHKVTSNEWQLNQAALDLSSLPHL
jgi:hypothetical protein